MSSSSIVSKCIICQQLTNPDDEGRTDVIVTLTDAPCMRCVKEIKDGNFLFVLISDKSDESKIRRLNRTWVVDAKDVIEEYGDLDRFDGERVVFIPEAEALKIGLLDERITDPETGIDISELNKQKEEDAERDKR